MKKPLVVALFGLTAAGLLNIPSSAKPANASTLPEGTKNAIKISLDTDAAAFKDQYAEGIGDDAYLVYGTAPLPCTSDAGTYAFKSNRLGSWWDPWTDITISFDFWTNHFIPGMNGLGVQYENSWNFSANANVVDQNGYAATCFDSTYLGQYGNGWVHREFSVPAVANNFVIDMWLTTALQVGTLKQTTGVIDMYYTNMKVKYNNHEVDLFGNDNSIYTVEEINKTISYQKVAESYTKKEWGVIEGVGWDCLASMTGINASRRCVEARTISVIDTLPSVCEISAQLPESLVAGIKYNLLSYATCSETVSIESIKKNGESVDISEADLTDYAFATEGTYSVTYLASKDGNQSRLTKEVVVASAETPVFVDADITAAVPATANAHQAIKLGKVNAFVGGVKNCAATPVVKNSDNESFQVTEVADGWTFQPTAKKNDTYKVFYKAVNGEFTTNSIEKTITVTDIDKPVIDFSGLTKFDVGSIYTVADVKASVGITDMSDGNIDVNTISIKDPLGNELVNDSGKFMAKYSGDYTIKVVSKADTDGNSSEAQTTVGTNQSEGLVLTQIVEVPEEKRAAGIVKDGRSQVWHTDYTLALGDKIVYDVMAYTEYDDGSYGFIPGVGGLGGQVNGSWAHVDALFAATESLDSTGISMARTADLSSKLHDSNNKPVWYTREYTIKEGDAVIYGNQFWHFAMTFETSAAVGSKIVTMMRNVVVYNAEGEIKGTLWNGTQSIGDEWKTENHNVGNVYIGATVDVTPIEIAGKIPTTAAYGATISFPKGLMKDPQTDTVLNASVTVKDPSNGDVTLSSTATSYSFVASKLGKYKVTVSASNAKFTTTKEYEIVVTDAEKPSVEIAAAKEGYVGGETVELTVAISDNETAFASLKDSGVTVTKDGVAIEANVVETANGYTVSFVGQEGTYTITAYATDASNNETVETFTVEVGPAPKGCIGSITGASFCLAMLAFAGLSVISSKKRKEN